MAAAMSNDMGIFEIKGFSTMPRRDAGPSTALFFALVM